MVGLKAGVGQSPAPPTDARRTPKFQRHPLGLSWLIGLVAIPLLITAIGYGAYERPEAVTGPTGDLPTLTTTSGTPSAPALSLSLLSISRSGNTITLIGDCPDDAAKAALMKSLKGLLTPGVNVIDQIRIDPIVHSLDFSSAEPVFTASVPIPDFSLKVELDTITLTGTAASGDQKDAVERAAVTAWPGMNIANKIAAKGAPPGPPGAAPCADLQAAINAGTGGPIFFADDGVSLTPADNQILTRVADQLKACPNARVTINGYTDNFGSEGLNIPLSAQRANTVADFLVAHGVARDHVVAKGLGSTNPIAGNDTAEGRAKNRRAEIVVS
ncbi:Peptidoglycan-binding protein ArfA [Mycobacterium simulans]|uniref:Peptidoglycan-binding protein ArfA n=1 Tax=Mycobacterium simulans TaxID=627089 RepID=A0A7Z7NBN5_9MYCO|nr:Peptidoglycan-binding protein ArfA [Mycobacterium simulans]